MKLLFKDTTAFFISTIVSLTTGSYLIYHDGMSTSLKLTLFITIMFVNFVASYIILKKRHDLLKKTSADLSDKLVLIAGLTEEIEDSNKNIEIISIDQTSTLSNNKKIISDIEQNKDCNTENIELSIKHSHENNSKVQLANQNIKKLVKFINNIVEINQKLTQQTEDNNQEFKKITQVITEIENKTKIINDIAMQTRLLAFNASVEAAQAGAKGKGFSVVAEEVGKLANMSDHSAKEITEMLHNGVGMIKNIIESTQKENLEIVQVIDQHINMGMKSAEDTENIFQEVMNSINELNFSITSISSSNQKLSDNIYSIEGITFTLQQLIQKNRLTTSQTSFTTNQLSQNISSVLADINNFHTIVHGENKLQTKSVYEFVWNDNLSTGVDDMDNEHKELIYRINLLNEHLKSGVNNEILMSYNYLLDYIVLHFRDEEQFMKQMGLPEYEAHKNIHEKLVAKAQRFKQDLLNDELDKRKLASFLKNWLVSHIQGVDRRYGDFYNEQQNNFQQAS